MLSLPTSLLIRLCFCLIKINYCSGIPWPFEWIFLFWWHRETLHRKSSWHLFMTKRQTRPGMVCRLYTKAVKHCQDKPRLRSKARITRMINQPEISLHYFVAKKHMKSVILNTSDSLIYLFILPHAFPESRTIFLWSVTKTLSVGPMIIRTILFGLKETAILKVNSAQLKLSPHKPNRSL